MSGTTLAHRLAESYAIHDLSTATLINFFASLHTLQNQ